MLLNSCVAKRLFIIVIKPRPALDFMQLNLAFDEFFQLIHGSIDG
ncbi:hypothetical protein LX64_02249 [Chitinophaga skermanii]|uniref:Uncharacterized protein n=1 Tax=Chitinophaga skermanii TaxID=331697 RepID=A0A327QMJ7_9BACT|nr:hypothetical protein LX64_02249 [Chitinophaga skermanii]